MVCGAASTAATYIFKAGHVEDIIQKGFNTFSNGRNTQQHPADEQPLSEDEISSTIRTEQGTHTQSQMLCLRNT